jgi:drug/metabolite transporter (DMT)-like permease
VTHTGEAKPDQIAQGIAIILASVITMAFADAIVKLVSEELTVWQVFVARSLFAIPCLVALACTSGNSLRPGSAYWVFVRSTLLVLTWLAFYVALPVLDLSVAAVAVYTNPILTTLLSAALLGERVSRRQWVGVLLGFVGVAVILRPGSEAFSWFILLPLLGAAFYSLAMVITRSKCQDEEAVTLALTLHGSFLVTGLIATIVLALVDLGIDTKTTYPFLFGDWAPMGFQEWGLMAFLGALSAAFFLGVARAYQIAPPQIIATFDYGYLVSAALWGFVFFSEEPDLMTVLGMILITLAGLLVTARTTKKINAAKADAA